MADQSMNETAEIKLDMMKSLSSARSICSSQRDKPVSFMNALKKGPIGPVKNKEACKVTQNQTQDEDDLMNDVQETENTS